MNWWRAFKAWAKQFKRDVAALSLALFDRRTPWLAKALIFFIVAYALSPIDLIPDFVPVLGLLDDLILLPALIALALRLIPATVMADCRARAERTGGDAPVWLRRAGLAIIVALWLAALVAMALWLWPTGEA